MIGLIQRFVVIWLMVTQAYSIGLAGELNVRVTSNGSGTITVVPCGGTAFYEVRGVLNDTLNEGLAGFAFDLAFSGGALGPADAPSGAPMVNFDRPAGATGPDGFGGTVMNGRLVRVGGVQNTIKNTADNAPFPIGSVITGVGHTEVVLVTGSLTAPVQSGTYTLSVSNLVATVIKQGEDGSGALWATERAGVGTIGNLTVIVPPASPPATAANDGPVCAGQPVTLLGGPDGMAGYLWTGPNAFTSPQQNPVVFPAVRGTYTLTVTDANNCRDTARTTVILLPDPCEPMIDCNANSTHDQCDILGGTSQDCNASNTPDECDLAAGSSRDCNLNGLPDECELLSHDCNHNAVPDGCDIAGATSYDCQRNTIPDECDVAAGTSADCNGNGVVDECDATLCYNLWDGFQPNPPFSFQRPLREIDYNGDGIYWDNPAGTAVIFAPGCETGTPFDNAVRVSVPATNPENGYLESEDFRTLSGPLYGAARAYGLEFKAKLSGGLNPRTDWQFFIYDGVLGRRVIEIDFTSTVSTRVPASQRGKVLVKNPLPGSGYTSTGVTVALNTCYAFEVTLDNASGTVQLYINGTPRLGPDWPPLNVEAVRMDYFRLQAVANGAGTTAATLFWLDDFELCITGGELAPPNLWDCNSNGTLDECDLTAGTSADCNTNGRPDECDIAAGTSMDADGDGVPDECPALAHLAAAVPADQSSLWRSANNTVRLTFDGDIAAPAPGQVLIQQMLDGGAFGPDLSGNFTFTVENVDIGGGDIRPRVLRIRETGASTVLTHRTWIAIRNAETPKRRNAETEKSKSQKVEKSKGGSWTGVAPFEVQYVVLIGDVNVDKKVLASDLSSIFPKIPTANAGDQERADANGDGRVLASDLSAVFPRIPSPAPPKPGGH